MKLLVQKIWVRKKCWVQKKFGSNKKRKLGQKKFGPKHFGLQKLRPSKIGSKKFGQIRSVAAEILLPGTNVARTYVGWTNGTMTVDIFSRWSQDSTFEILSKSDQ